MKLQFYIEIKNEREASFLHQKAHFFNVFGEKMMLKWCFFAHFCSETACFWRFLCDLKFDVC